MKGNTINKEPKERIHILTWLLGSSDCKGAISASIIASFFTLPVSALSIQRFKALDIQ